MIFMQNMFDQKISIRFDYGQDRTSMYRVVSLVHENALQVLIFKKAGKSEWIGDGFCDDINNNEQCHFDGGDCCGSNVKRHFCMNCTCIGKFFVFFRQSKFLLILLSKC